MTPKTRKHVTEAGVAVALLLFLLWLLSHYLARGPGQQALDTTDPTGQSAQPNFTPTAINVPPLTVNTLQGSYPLNISLPIDQFQLTVPADDCECSQGANCPVTPYTIASINKMLALGTAYANAMIQAGNNTAAAIAQQADQTYIYPVVVDNQLQAA